MDGVTLVSKGFPSGTMVKKPPANTKDVGLIPELGRALVSEWQPAPVFLPGKFHGHRSLVSYSPWVVKSRTGLSY